MRILLYACWVGFWILPLLPAAEVAPAASSPGAPVQSNVPRPGDADYPLPSPSARHQQKGAAVRSGRYDLALIGDSITHTIGELGGKYEPLKAVWEKHYAPRRAINLGHNGYRTENILWNLTEGELEFIVSPKVIMILLGTNNTDDRHYPKVHTAEQILAGTRAIVELIKRRHPATKILLLRIFPRGGDGEAGVGPDIFHASPQCIETCRRAGELTRQLADGKQVFWLDVNHLFLRADGTINTDLMPDLLHPNAAGAEAWAQAIEPTLARLMDEREPAPAQRVHLLPGQRQFVFSMYGVPGDLEPLRQVAAVMRDQKLGNAFDPGPGPNAGSKPVFDFLASLGWPVVFYSGGEMQIKGGRSVFGGEHEAALAPMDQAGVFTAYQLGEWGYHFHNLTTQEAWWRAVYGQEFDSFKHLMKPKGLAGYDRFPQSRRECYDIVRAYFLSRKRDLLGRVISVTGHSHYEAYVGEWGASCIGLEVGENIAFTQSKLAFARGASRQWEKPWSVQVSPWFSGACTTSGPLRKEGGGARGLDAGHSLSFYERMWLHGWFAGAAMVTPENSVAIFFEKPEPPWTLTSHGRKASELFQFMQGHDRGTPHTPVAIVLDHLAGYNGYMDRPWGILTPTAGDREVRDLFDHQLFPGSDHIHRRPDAANPEASYLRATPFGEVFDVLLTSVPPEVLPGYPVIVLAGDIEFDDAFLSELEKSLRRGSRVLMSARHRDALGAQFHRIARQGAVEVLDPWVNPETGRATAISSQRLGQLVGDLFPFEISGEPVQYSINRNSQGWVMEFINNRGVIKRPDQPAQTDPAASARVRVRSTRPFASVREWRSGRTRDARGPVELEIGPGSVEYLEWSERGW